MRSFYFALVIFLFVSAQPLQSQSTTTVILTSSSNPSTFGSVVTLTATLNPSNALGTVTFYNGVTPIGSAVVSAGVATFTTILLPPDVSQLTARYNGSSAGLPGVSAALAQIVNGAPQGYFSTNQNYVSVPASTNAAGSLPIGVAVGDFNNDGKQDLAVANATSNNVSILLGAGDGTFLPAHDYPAGAGAIIVVIADFNGDGKQDVAVTNGAANTVSVLLGNGDGTFQAARNFATGVNPLYLVVADFNSDGKPDLAIENSSSNNVTVLLGLGDGTFAAPATYAVGGNPTGITTADFNGDHIPDLAVANQGVGTITILYGNTNGALTTGPTLLTNNSVSSVVAGDLNGDNRPDIIFSALGPYSVVAGAYLNNGDGTFTATPGFSVSNVPNRSGAAFIAADINNDGILDLFFDGGQILYGAGDGVFDSEPYSGINPAYALAVGDFTGTGRVDFVATDQATGLIDLYAGQPIAASAYLAYLPALSPGESATINFTVRGNGPNPTPPPIGGTMYIYFGNQVLGSAPVVNGVGAFTTKLLPGIAYGLYGVYAGDANYADGAVTYAIASVISSTQPGTYVAGAPIPLPSFPTGLAMNDFNNDGREDLAVIDGPPGAAGQVTILLGNGDGSFTNVGSVAVGVSPQAIAAADLNLDGNPDLVIADAGSNSITVLLGKGDGTFQAPTDYAVGTNPVALTILDFNQDLKNDILVVNQVSGDISVLLGNGDGTFQQATTLPAVAAPSGITSTGDSIYYRDVSLAVSSAQSGGVLLPYTGVGLVGSPVSYSTSSAESTNQFFSVGTPGLIAVDSTAGEVSLFAFAQLGQPLSLKPTPQVYPVGSNPVALSQLALNFVASGVSGGGTAPPPDLAFADAGSNSVSILPFPGPASVYPVGAKPVAIVAGDFNRDGIPDLAVANGNGASITILFGAGTPYPIQATPFNSITPAGTAFLPALQVTTAPNVPVQFLLPASGPSGIFAGSGRAVTVMSNGSGVATAPVVVANGTAGNFGVGISAGLSASSANFQTTASNCIFVVSPSPLTLTGAAQTVNLTLTAGAPNCAWAAASDSSWLTLGTTNGTGGSVIVLTASANTGGDPRSGNLLIAGQTVAVTQDVTTQVFTDVVPTDSYFDAANLMSQAGLTSGCTATQFCPLQNITRAEMAVFVVRGVFGSDNFNYSPTPHFLDVPLGAPYFAWIQKLFELGITQGCGDGNFCPNDDLPRDQAAVFIIRARYGSTTSYTYPANPFFTDVPADASFFSEVQRLKLDGITSGCSATLFCPTETVTRGQIAVFAARGLLNRILPAGAPFILSASPNQVLLNAPTTVMVTGVNTNWAQGLTYLAPIPGFTIGALTVTSPTSLTVSLTATPAALPQPVTLQVITGSEQAILPNRVTIVTGT